MGAARVSLDNGRTYVPCASLSEAHAERFAACHPYDADVFAEAEGDGPMTAWLARFAVAYRRRYGCWPVI